MKRPGNHSTLVARPASRQQGAALVIALVLLLVLTVLAVSGMNSASTELVMTGNEQYRQEAFRDAEISQEKALQNGIFDGATIDTSISGTVGSGTYASTITPQLGGTLMTTVAGTDMGILGTIQYELRNVGTTVRSTSVTTWQGVAQLVPANPGVFQTNSTLGSTF